MKIGVLKETKVPVDRRVPLTPAQCKEVTEKFPGVEVYVQKSDIRAFSDAEYEAQGVSLTDDISHCDVLVGVKEVALEHLISGKTYFFFSHTIKKQDYNRKLLQTVLERKIRLIDYETLTDEQGIRVIAFGRYAGLVGAYNGLRAYGLREKLFELKPAHECKDMAEMFEECKKVRLSAIKIVVTGGGRVAKGAQETLAEMGIPEVEAQALLREEFEHAVYAQLNPHDYNKAKDGKDFVREVFFKHPKQFEGDFLKYTSVSDILIAAAYWDPNSPVLFTPEDTKNPGFKTRTIADITCDIEGSIPTTKRPSVIDDPFYDYDPKNGELTEAFSGDDHVTVMAVDNLPCELPRNASEDFGYELVNNVLPNFIKNSREGMIARATITDGGSLTETYAYLQDFADGKE